MGEQTLPFIPRLGEHVILYLPDESELPEEAKIYLLENVRCNLNNYTQVKKVIYNEYFEENDCFSVTIVLGETNL